MSAQVRWFLLVAVAAGMGSTACLEVITEEPPASPSPVVFDDCCYAPSPAPARTAAPTPTPNPDPGHIPQNVPSNTTQIARVDLKVYYVDCDGEVVDDAYATHAPVGCRVHFDATPQDHMGRHTRGYEHKWYLDGPAQFSGLSSMTPTALGQRPGVVTAQVWVDGVMSPTVQVTIYTR